MTHENENGAIAVAEPVNSGADAVASAVESLASHLHPKVSWDLGDHPMPVSYTHLDVYKRQRTSCLTISANWASV